jgi:glucuronate isomerase
LEKTLVLTLEDALAETPVLDPHTHLDAAHLAARGLHDIVLYHMVISDLASAGCPSRARLPEDPDAAESERRLLEALPYLPHIRNTGIFWGARILLRDLYGWPEPVTPENWRRLDGLIRERAGDPAWPREVMKKAGIRRACTELWRGREGQAVDVLQYALEWAFFARAQWGGGNQAQVNDIPLYELERTWSQAEPEPPLPVTLGASRPEAERPVRTVEDVRSAVAHYAALIPYGKVLSTAQHLSTDIHFRPVTDAEMAQALRRRARATTADRDIYASYILEAFLTELERHGDEIVFQFSFGAEPLPFETGSKLRQETIFQAAEIIARHPRLHFQVFLSSEHADQALCTLAREIPNLSLAGYWWHNFFPGAIRKIMGERLDMLAANKQIGFFSDAYCVDWQYAKAVLVRKELARALAERVEKGQYTLDEALQIARAILYDSPQSLLGMRPRDLEESTREYPPVDKE